MQTTNRWRKWRPSDEIIGEFLDQAPPKPSKATSGGFEGAVLGPIRLFQPPYMTPPQRSATRSMSCDSPSSSGLTRRSS
jgi:hypothetical protein